MARPTQRVRLESGIKLNINRLVQAGAIRSGAHIESRTAWSNSYYGDLTASMEAKISSTEEGWFRIRIEEVGLDQRINLVSRPRHFGGRHWYFICRNGVKLACA
jgi:hypothetical protein